MKFRILAVLRLSVVSIGFSAVPALAQQAISVPANVPPPGFTGAQFVDNKGCIFIRAGTRGAVTWVPRVTRDRQPICGYRPSFQSTRANTPAARVTVLEAETAPKPAPPVASGTALFSGLLLQEAQTADLPPNTRVLPRHLYEQRKALSPVSKPPGYRAAWTDGRLNPRRAEQTLEGQAQMRRVWTNTVPRRLVD